MIKATPSSATFNYAKDIVIIESRHWPLKNPVDGHIDDHCDFNLIWLREIIELLYVRSVYFWLWKH